MKKITHTSQLQAVATAIGSSNDPIDLLDQEYELTVNGVLYEVVKKDGQVHVTVGGGDELTADVLCYLMKVNGTLELVVNGEPTKYRKPYGPRVAMALGLLGVAATCGVIYVTLKKAA